MMTYRKTWFSYVLWVVYTMLCAIFLVFAGNYVCVSFFPDSLGNGGLAVGDVQLAGFLALPLTVALYGAVRGISVNARKKFVGGKMLWKILECIVLWALLVFGIFLRVMRALEYIQLQQTAEASAQNVVNGIEYFDRAMVTAGGFAEPSSYGSAYLYVAVLSFVLSFLGNKVASAIILQVFLQIAGLLLAYAVTRKSAGKIPAGIVLCYLACSPAYLEMLKNLGPECLFFDLYLLILLACFSFVKGYCNNRFKKVAAFVGALGTGLLIGVLGYLDLAAFTLLPVLLVAAFGKKRYAEGADVNNPPGVSAAVIVVAFAACAAGACGMLGLVSLHRGTLFQHEIQAWAALQTAASGTFGFRPRYPYSLDMLLFGMLAALAAFLVIEFFRGKEQNYMLWILLCILTAPTPLAVCGAAPYGLLSMYLWGVLAGLGLQNCIFGGKVKLLKTLIEEINQAAEEVMLQEKKEEKKVEESATDAEEALDESAMTAGQDTPEEEAASKPRFLENPLPLPKKHVPRQMDYQYAVDEKDMKYDIEVDENDDFDLS